MSYQVEVIRGDGTKEIFPIDANQVTLGRSGMVNVSLPMQMDLELEHVLIAPKGPQGCWVSVAKNVKAPLLFKGKPFGSGMVAWGTEFSLGALRVRLVVTGQKKVKKEKSSNAFSYIVLALLLGMGGLYLWKPKAKSSVPEQRVKAPVIIETYKGTCTNSNPKNKALTWEEQAVVVGERYHFDAADGIMALKHYAHAIACYQKAKMPDDVKRMSAHRLELVRTIESDYAALQLRLARAIAAQNNKETLRFVRQLRDLTAHLKTHEYSKWLSQVERVVEAEIVMAEKKAKE